MIAELLFEQNASELIAELDPNAEVIAEFQQAIPTPNTFDYTTNPGFVTFFVAGVEEGKVRLLS
jgi:hypothetical protein